jgi:hypothetical protein
MPVGAETVTTVMSGMVLKPSFMKIGSKTLQVTETLSPYLEPTLHMEMSESCSH